MTSMHSFYSLQRFHCDGSQKTETILYIFANHLFFLKNMMNIFIENSSGIHERL